MKKYSKILFFSLLFVGISISANANNVEISEFGHFYAQQDKDNSITLEVTINYGSKIFLEDVSPTAEYLEVFSILGVKVANINLKAAGDRNYYLDLAKGLYIIKAGKTAQKIIVR